MAGPSVGQMQFAMGGGGGGSIAGGSEGGFAQHFESAPLLAFLLPHGHQSILTAQRGGLMDAKLPGLFGGNLFEPRAKGLFAELKQRMGGSFTTGSPEISGIPIEGAPIQAASMGDLGSFSPGGPRGGGGSVELG